MKILSYNGINSAATAAISSIIGAPCYLKGFQLTNLAREIIDDPVASHHLYQKAQNLRITGLVFLVLALSRAVDFIEDKMDGALPISIDEDTDIPGVDIDEMNTTHKAIAATRYCLSVSHVVSFLAVGSYLIHIADQQENSWDQIDYKTAGSTMVAAASIYCFAFAISLVRTVREAQEINNQEQRIEEARARLSRIPALRRTRTV